MILSQYDRDQTVFKYFDIELFRANVKTYPEIWNSSNESKLRFHGGIARQNDARAYRAL